MKQNNVTGNVREVQAVRIWYILLEVVKNLSDKVSFHQRTERVRE